MSNINRIFENITSCGEIAIVQRGFLYRDRVDTRVEKLIFKDFVTLVRHLLEHKHLEVSFEIKGEKNASEVIQNLKNSGISVEILRNELHWITELEKYEIDILLHLNLSTYEVQKLIKRFYVVEDAVLIYPVGYKSWGKYFEEKTCA